MAACYSSSLIFAFLIYLDIKWYSWFSFYGSQVKFCKSTFGVSSQCTVNNGESLPADHTSYSTEQSEDCRPHGDSKVTGFDLSGELREWNIRSA